MIPRIAGMAEKNAGVTPQNRCGKSVVNQSDSLTHQVIPVARWSETFLIRPDPLDSHIAANAPWERGDVLADLSSNPCFFDVYLVISLSCQCHAGHGANFPFSRLQ